MKDPNAPKRGDPGYFDSIPDRGSRGGPGGGGGGGGFDCVYLNRPKDWDEGELTDGSLINILSSPISF